MEAVIFTRGIWVTIANLLGFNIPKADQVPETIKKLFNGGVSGFKFWDIIKIIAILLVIVEAFRYIEDSKNSNRGTSPTTIGVFILLIIILGVTTIPDLYNRLKTTDFNLESLK